MFLNDGALPIILLTLLVFSEALIYCQVELYGLGIRSQAVLSIRGAVGLYNVGLASQPYGGNTVGLLGLASATRLNIDFSSVFQTLIDQQALPTREISIYLGRPFSEAGDQSQMTIGEFT